MTDIAGGAASVVDEEQLEKVATARAMRAASGPYTRTIELDGRLSAATPRLVPAPATPAAAGEASAGLVRPLRFFRGHYHRVGALLVTEAAVVALAFYVALGVRFGAWSVESLEDAVGALWPRVAAAMGIMAVCLAAMGLYQLRQRVVFSGVVARVFAAVMMAEAVLACLFYALPGLFVGRGVMLLMAPVAGAGLLAVRYAYGRLIDGDVFKRRVLVWGGGREAATIAARLRRRSDQRGFRIVGYVRCPGQTTLARGTFAIGSRGELLECLAAHRVEEIVVAMDDRRRGFPTEFLRECRMRGVMVRDIVDFLEQESGHVNVELAKPSWLIFSQGFRSDVLRASAKRAFDLVAAAALLALSLPLTLATAIAIWIDDRGPIFYRQERTGQHGRPFRMIKFRSMAVNAEANGAVWAMKNDPRVTRVGAFIRRVRIDEIPQAINVLLGEMSFVGPRPERPGFVDGLAKKIPFYMERHFVKPGITGWAQVRFPYGSTEADAREKLGYDLFYVKNHNLLFDLVILLRTVEIVVFRLGSR